MLREALLPTPSKSDGEKTGQRYGKGDLKLSGALLPTPTAHERTHTPRPVDHGRQLAKEIALLPTPTATPYGNNQSPSDGAAVRPGRGVARLLPTPTSNDAKSSDYQYSRGDHSKPVLKLPGAAKKIGAPTPEQSTDGKKSPAPLLNPCFVEWMLGLPARWSDPDCPLSATEFKSKRGSSSVAACSPTCNPTPTPHKRGRSPEKWKLKRSR